MDTKAVKTAPEALVVLEELLEEFRVKLEPHDFMCVMLYLKNKYIN